MNKVTEARKSVALSTRLEVVQNHCICRNRSGKRGARERSSSQTFPAGVLQWDYNCNHDCPPSTCSVQNQDSYPTRA